MAGEVILGPEIISGADLLVTTQTFQQLIIDADPAVRPEIADMFGDIVGDEPTHFGAKRVELFASTAYLFDDGQTSESTLLPFVELTNPRLRGRLGPVVYFEVNDSLPLLAWTLKTAKLRDVTTGNGSRLEDTVVDEIYAAGADIRRPIYVPVSGIQSALVAA